MDIDQERIKLIIEALDEKGAVNKACFRCGYNRFQLAGETLMSLQDVSGNVPLGAPAIPVVMVICKKCGNMWHHAIVALGVGERS